MRLASDCPQLAVSFSLSSVFTSANLIAAAAASGSGSLHGAVTSTITQVAVTAVTIASTKADFLLPKLETQPVFTRTTTPTTLKTTLIRARDKYREVRLKQYKNYKSLGQPHQDLKEECLQVEKGKSFYDFHYNTRLVKSTIVHFQLRNLLWATSKHDVYLMQNFSVMHWNSLHRRGSEVLNVAKPIVPTEISTMAVKDNLLVARGFQGELICKHMKQPGVAFCSKLTKDENAITNAVDIFQNPT